MESEPIRKLLSRLARDHPDAVAVVLPDGNQTTFAALQARAAQVASSVPPGGRIGVRLANDLASLAALHGVWQAGSAVVAMGYLVPDEEAERRLVEVGAAALVRPTAGAPEVHPVAGEAAAAQEAVVMFTSGTTGRPKAARLPEASLWASLRGIARGSGLPDDGRPPRLPMRAARPVFVPIAHMGGLLGSLTAFHLGGPILLCPKWTTELAFDVLEHYPITSLGLTPAMVYDLVVATGDRTLGSVRSVGVGTAPLPETTRIAFEQRYGVPVLRNYGQTEFAGAIAFERFADVVAGRRPPGSVGRLAPGVELRIVDAAGAEVPGGEVGEIVARGPSAMAGYLGTEATDGGWIATGDLGFLHDGDMLTIVGRTRDMVVCGGFNIYPSQVEHAVNDLPHVLDSAVAGVPDDRLGEVPVALVVTDGTELTLDEVRAALRARLSAYELPRRLDVVPTIPRTDGGKVDRDAVAAHFAGARA